MRIRSTRTRHTKRHYSLFVSNIGSGNELNSWNNKELPTLVKTNDTSLLPRMWEKLNSALAIKVLETQMKVKTNPV